MLQIKNLTITHRKDLRVILKDFSMVLNDGDKAAIIGEEGNGKSTLMKLIFDEALVDDYVDFSGEIIKNGARIGYLAQELLQVEKEKSIYEYCSECEAFYMMSPKELAEIANKLALSLELFYSEQKVGALSGGEKVKLQLARILMEQPDILFLDEPSNDIDLQTLAWLEQFILECRLPVLFISHDEMLLERTANKIIHIEQIKRKTETRYTVAVMGYAEYVEKRRLGFAHQEQVARKERSEYEKQQERFRKIQQKVEHQQNAISRQDPHGGRLLKKKMHAVKALEHRFEKEFADMTEIPETEDAIFIKFGEKIVLPNGKRVLDFELEELLVSKQEPIVRTEEDFETKYQKIEVLGIEKDEKRLLAKHIKLSVIGPEHICIVGKNGTGKTTLIRKIAEALQKRQDIKTFYMPQNYEELLDLQKTPVDFLVVNGDKEEISRARTYLGSMKYTADEMSHPISELSGGQKAKLLFLKMSMEGCNVLILDEPTRNFSPLSGPVIRDMLRNYGGAIISISHDRKYISDVCDKVYELTKNGLVEGDLYVKKYL